MIRPLFLEHGFDVERESFHSRDFGLISWLQRVFADGLPQFTVDRELSLRG